LNVSEQGGYFIIGGNEKVLIAQERMANDHIYVFGKKQMTAECRSTFAGGVRTSTVSVQMTNDDLITVALPYIKEHVPLFIVFRAFGLTADREIIVRICDMADDVELMDILKKSVEVATPIHDQIVALDFIGKRGAPAGALHDDRVKYARELLQKDFLPHVGIGDYADRKCFFLGLMVRRLLDVHLGRRPEDDRDHFANKRIDLAGPLLSSLFRSLFRKLVKEVRTHVQRCVDRNRAINMVAGINKDTITRGLRYALATGNWGMAGTTAGRVGVSQVLNRLTFASTLSHLRRINSPIPRQGKLTRPRQLHNTHWGIVCCAETPGAAILFTPACQTLSLQA
jgi:DNA-directed RNA polymerase II subunit RPB2